MLCTDALGPIEYWGGVNLRRTIAELPQQEKSEQSLNIHPRSVRQTTDPEKTNHETDDEIYHLDPYNIYRQLTKIGKLLPNANVTVEVIGKTVEYNDIVLLKITERPKGRFRSHTEGKYAEDVYEKKIIFIVHGLSIKGFDQIPCLSTVQYFAALLQYYLDHLNKFDIFLIPMANPDGLNYPLKFWNKNTSPQKACPGVALDRNFDVAWNFTRLSSSCSQQYPGFVPFSEAETQAIRGIFHYYHHKIIAYINVHAGGYDEKTFKGDAVLYPRGYTDLQEDDDVYLDLKGEIDEAMRNASFRVMSVTVDTLHSWYGMVSGTSVDYAALVYGIPFALEFVMQPYSKTFNFETFQEDIAYDTLSTIWSRIIKAVFNYIFKSLHQTDRRRYKKM
ncbi:carboxypeptidase B-like isoform X2 [Battus philenor]|uniref:carboxypeptidase B-like isoform X2 n=1 Tax=Battus philenor TaxID=42288 RepID=UPI0035D05F66